MAKTFTLFVVTFSSVFLIVFTYWRIFFSYSQSTLLVLDFEVSTFGFIHQEAYNTQYYKLLMHSSSNSLALIHPNFVYDMRKQSNFVYFST